MELWRLCFFVKMALIRLDPALIPFSVRWLIILLAAIQLEQETPPPIMLILGFLKILIYYSSHRAVVLSSLEILYS